MKFEQMKRLCTQKRNYYFSILRKSKREFYGNINKKDASDNKPFLKTVKAFVSDETVIQSKTALLDMNLPLAGDKKAAATLKKVF